MPFRGDDPLGTPGGQDVPQLPQDMADIRIAIGGSYIAYLLVNGPISVRQRSSIESVVRTLTAKGLRIVTIILRENGAVVDNDTGDINASTGIRAVSVSPGVVTLEIPTAGITTTMLTDALVTAAKIAAGAVGTTQLQDLAVTATKFADGAVSTTKIADGAVTRAKVAPGIVPDTFTEHVTATQTYTTSTNNLVNDIHIDALANETWFIEWSIFHGSNNTGGLRFGVTAPSGANGRVSVLGRASSALTAVIVPAMGLNLTGTITLLPETTTQGHTRIAAHVRMGATPGRIQPILWVVVGGQQILIYTDSTIVATRRQ